jgi:hypothetical protein
MVGCFEDEDADVIVIKPCVSRLLRVSPFPFRCWKHKITRRGFSSGTKHSHDSGMGKNQLCNFVPILGRQPILLLISIRKSAAHVEAESKAKRTIKAANPTPVMHSCKATPSSMRVHHGGRGQNPKTKYFRAGLGKMQFEKLGAMNQSSNQRIAHFLFFAFLTLTPLLLGFGS